ncbi:ALDH-like protein [Linderina pennispora]|uniref:ALDH-like protein n=1 Tax=Linderina pennispora TaxID=61395 RepID=A0A1Y1WC91_9FUNG|nr:ALDH-like protein [Linderina pennispora]ORX71160.1 ALDH-like protein [Linderina pennispora]
MWWDSSTWHTGLPGQRCPWTERTAYLRRIADLIEANNQLLAEFESLDQGKPVKSAAMMDFPACSWLLPPVLRLRRGRHRGKLGPALALGNTVIVKPTELTSVTPYLLTKIIDAAGVPPGVINILFGTGQGCWCAAGQAQGCACGFIHWRLADRLQDWRYGLAASTSAFRLELGGKNPSNQGEICLCTSRVYVQRSIYDKFLDAFRQKVLEQVRVGNPSDPQTFYGPVVSAQHQEKVTGYIRLAQQEGANVEFLINPADKAVKNIAADGKLTIDGFEGGYYIAPTLITNISQKRSLVPVVAVLPFDTEEEGVALANDTEYGLGAVVWTEDKQRLARVQSQINSGMVWGNCWLSWDDEMPFGGMGCSGTSREHGKWSLDFYTELKAIYTYNE